MKKKRTALLTKIIVILIITYGCSETITNKQSKLKPETIQTHRDNNISELKIFEKEAEGESFPNIKVLTVNNDTIKLSGIINNSTIVFRIYESSCAPCVEDNINTLDTINLLLNYIVIGNFYNRASFKYFAKQCSVDNCYMILDKDILMQQSNIERNQITHYFVLDTYSCASNFHAIIKGNHQHTLNYLLALK